MKKLKLSLANMEGAEVLSREQLKKVMGGETGSGPGTPGGNNGNPCPENCTRYCHQITYNFGGEPSTMTYTGTCPSSIGGTSCHNYCCEGNNSANYYWC